MYSKTGHFYLLLTYSMEDAELGAFSIFFTLSPSFLSFQRTIQKIKRKSNAQTLFGMEEIPCDNHIRSLLDPVPPSQLSPMFSNTIDRLNNSGHLDTFRSFNNTLLLPLDATGYFISNQIHCKNCSTKKHKNGKTTNSHSANTPVFVKSGSNKVISLQPEFITPQDGHTKQDCENAAAKRWLNQWAPVYKNLGVTILGDDLYCKQSLCELILKQGLNFILICKPDSHKPLYEWMEEFESLGDVQTHIEKRWTGQRHEIDTYRFVNNVPLRDTDDARYENWCELTTTLEDGTVIYKNAFATNNEITKEYLLYLLQPME